MKKRIGNDIKDLKWSIIVGGEPFDLNLANDLRLEAVDAKRMNYKIIPAKQSFEGNQLTFDFANNDLTIGVFNTILSFWIADPLMASGKRYITIDKTKAFEIVSHSEEEDLEGAEFTTELKFGINGKNYYEIWLKYHEGTEEDMIAWHQQPAVDASNTVTEQVNQFIEDSTEQLNGLMDEVASHPTYIGIDHYVYVWDHTTQSYNKRDVYCKGDAFTISKTYPSVAAMEADFAGTDTKKNDFVLISTGSVEDPDNAKMYVKDTSVWLYIADLSGAIGFTGKTPQFSIGTVTTGTAGSSVAVTLSEDGVDASGNPKFKLNFAIPQGAKGDKGDPFTYEDFTPEQIATLQQPATEAAQLLETEVSNVSTIGVIKIIDENTVLATGDGQGSFVVPEELNGCEIFKVHAAVSTPSSSGLPTFQLRTLAGNDVLSTKVSIDQGAYSSYAATTPHVVNPAYKTVSTGDILFPDVDIAGTGAKGARLIITFKHPTV